MGSSDGDREARSPSGSRDSDGIESSDDGGSSAAETETSSPAQVDGVDGETEEDVGKLADSMSRGVGRKEQSIPTEFRLSVTTLGVIALVVCAMGFFIVSRVGKKQRSKSKKKKKKKRSLRLFPSTGDSSGDGQSGQALVEFLLSIITFLFVILGVIQLALILNAYTLVRYAAYNSARAGIVHGGDLEKMREAARISLLSIFPRHGRADHLLGITENYLGAKVTDQNQLDDFDKPITEVTILQNTGIGGGSVVTFDDPADAENAVITVQVIHHYEMVIPLVNRMLYYLYFKFIDDAYEGEDVDQLAAKTDKLRRDGELKDIEFRFPLTAHYTMRMQSDYEPS